MVCFGVNRTDVHVFPRGRSGRINGFCVYCVVLPVGADKLHVDDLQLVRNSNDQSVVITFDIEDDATKTPSSPSRQPETSDRRFAWPDLDVDVVAESCQAVHQLALRQVVELTSEHGRHFGLRDAHAFCGCLLRQAQPLDGR